ncbi:MAG: hypothetical protein ACREL7_08420 [Longimicrobiales bacterium]
MLLSTLVLSFSEAAWASACDPSMAEMRESSMADMAGMDDVPARHDDPPGNGNDQRAPGDYDGDCPFALPGGVGCAASASLPATVTLTIEPAPVRALPPVTADLSAHLLHAHSIFHPPKA